MECFRLLLKDLAWIKYQFLIGIRDLRKAGCLWGMMRSVGGVRKSEHEGWVSTGQTVNKEYYVEVLWVFRKRFLGKRPALFKSGRWHFHQDNAPVHNSILVTEYLSNMGTQTVPYPPYSPDLPPYDFWLFPKLKENRYETIEEMKEAVTKVIGTLTQEDVHGPSRRCWNVTTSALQPKEITSKGTRVSCVYYQ